MARDGYVVPVDPQAVTSVKKKTQPDRSWILVDAMGQGTILDADKNAIMNRVQIRARDLRILDALLSYPSTILGREGAIVLNLEVSILLTLLSSIYFMFVSLFQRLFMVSNGCSIWKPKWCWARLSRPHGLEASSHQGLEPKCFGLGRQSSGLEAHRFWDGLPVLTGWKPTWYLDGLTVLRAGSPHSFGLGSSLYGLEARMFLGRASSPHGLEARMFLGVASGPQGWEPKCFWAGLPVLTG